MEALLYFALVAGVFFVMMRFGCGSHVMGHGHGQRGAPDKVVPRTTSSEPQWVPPETDVDPVCGKTVRTDEAKSAVHDGTVYYFCTAEHREVFEGAPHLYAGTTAEQPPKEKDHAHG